MFTVAKRQCSGVIQFPFIDRHRDHWLCSSYSFFSINLFTTQTPRERERLFSSNFNVYKMQAYVPSCYGTLISLIAMWFVSHHWISYSFLMRHLTFMDRSSDQNEDRMRWTIRTSNQMDGRFAYDMQMSRAHFVIRQPKLFTNNLFSCSFHHIKNKWLFIAHIHIRATVAATFSMYTDWIRRCWIVCARCSLKLYAFSKTSMEKNVRKIRKIKLKRAEFGVWVSEWVCIAHAKGAMETLTRAKSINSIDLIWYCGFVQSNDRLLCMFTAYLAAVRCCSLQLLLTRS